MEDGIAVGGLAVATGAMIMTLITGEAVYDAYGSLFVGNFLAQPESRFFLSPSGRITTIRGGGAWFLARMRHGIGSVMANSEEPILPFR